MSSRQVIEQITEAAVAQIYEGISPEGPPEQFNEQQCRELSEGIGTMKNKIMTLLPEVTCGIGRSLMID
jgi:hypothetical protein